MGRGAGINQISEVWDGAMWDCGCGLHGGDEGHGGCWLGGVVVAVGRVGRAVVVEVWLAWWLVVAEVPNALALPSYDGSGW